MIKLADIERAVKEAELLVKVRKLGRADTAEIGVISELWWDDYVELGLIKKEGNVWRDKGGKIVIKAPKLKPGDKVQINYNGDNE